MERFGGTMLRLALNNKIAIKPIQYLNHARGIKTKDVLTLRCDSCYYKKIDDRWHVLCTKFGRHKQMEKYEGNGKNNWIVSDVVIGKGPHFRKRVQYLGQHLGQYDP